MPRPDFSDSNFKKIRQAHNIHSRSEIRHYDMFSRHGVLDPYGAVTTTREYIFFTRPDLHLLDGSTLNPELSNIPIFRETYDRYHHNITQLQKSAPHQESPFINLLSNTVTTKLDLPSIDSTEMENSATIYGETITYRDSSITSDSNHEFSLEFEDNKYTEVYMLFKIWDQYIREKSKGGITPPSRTKYTDGKVLHDQVCAYKIIVGEDLETIIFYAKLWGVFPKNVPRDAFSQLNENGGLAIPIRFHAEWVMDMDPMILMDFNNLTKGYYSNYDEIPLYDSVRGHANGEWCHIPYITYQANTVLAPHGLWKLKWR